MKAAFLTFALAAAMPLAQAAVTQADRYTVEDPFFTDSYQVSGDTLVVDRPTGPLSFVENQPALSGSAFMPDFSLLFFTPAAGYRITGFDTVFDLSFTGGTYDTFVSSGLFQIDGGPSATFSASGPTVAQLAHHVVGDLFDVGFGLGVEGLADFCLPGSDPQGCANGVGIGNVLATLQLHSITITPVLVAVPEPATWLAMLGGLVAVGAVARRRR